MTLERRIEEIKATEERQRWEEEQKRRQEEEARRKSLRDRYARELPGVLAQQRVLFEELRAAGLVGMVEEMIRPDRLQLPLTDEETRRMSERIKEKLKTLPAVIPPETTREVWDSIWDQKWEGEVLYPLQREDGSLDPSLGIAIDDQVLVHDLSRSYSVRSLVEITYTPDRDLTIKGQEEITFPKAAGPNMPDRETLKTALATAFLHPQKVDPILRD